MNAVDSSNLKLVGGKYRNITWVCTQVKLNLKKRQKGQYQYFSRANIRSCDE